jgi:hypothetical protein
VRRFVSKVDCLTRTVAFLSCLLEAGVIADLPQIEGATGPCGRAGAAHIISERVKAALAAAKARGVKLGGFRGKGRADHLHAAAQRGGAV